MISSFDLEDAIAASASYIESKHSADGLWRDFYTLAGASSDWVTGFVVFAIACSDRLGSSALSARKALLSRQRPNGGWSYNETVPTDCDSTAWVLVALATAPTWRPSAIERAIRYVRHHRDEEIGGFATYSIRDGIDRFIGVADRELTRGWLATHPCVTSVVLQSLLLNGEPTKSEMVRVASEYLLREREASGVWRSYWWKGFGYSTYNSLRALSMARALDPRRARKTLRFLLSTQQEEGGWNDSSGQKSEVFATAFVLLSLLLFPNAETLKAAEKGVSWLLGQQCQDGGWPTVPILRIPPPMVEDPENLTEWRTNGLGTGVIVEDHARIFTSSATLWALSTFKSMTQ